MAIIGSGLEAAVMRNKMESKEALAAKGSLYVGTGNKTTVTKADKTTVSIPETVAFNPPDMDGGVMIRDTSTDNATGWKVDKIKTENLENGQVERAANAENILAFDGTYGSLAQACLNMIYPVGSIYMSANNVSPQKFLGGAWEPWGAGRVPVGVNIHDADFITVEKTGGEKTHTLTESEMPTHKHTGTEAEAQKFDIQQGSTFKTIRYIDWFTTEVIQSASNAVANPDGVFSGNGEVVVEHGITAGGGQPHNNLQPYITCYMWKRIS